MSDRKPLLIGQAPSRATDGQASFSGRSGRFLASLVGLGHAEFLAAVEAVNLVDRWPGKRGRGDAFPACEGRARADAICLDGRSAVLVGGAVASVFGIKGKELLAWMPYRGGRVAVLPHPSGLNRWWNDPQNRQRARCFLRRLLTPATPPVGGPSMPR